MADVTLPDAPWRHRAGMDALVAALGPGNARFVGGAVRDTLLGLPVSDVDIATPLPPDDVMQRLRKAGIRVVPTGIAHGTVTAVLADGPVEVTTLRHDVETDGRHAVVAFSDDWRADAARRDFTFNALYADPDSGAVHDWFGGLDDLAAARVRFIGDPLTRIAEDYLRILRFFRFHARFGGEAFDPDGLAACIARANDLMALSRERIADELSKLLLTPRAAPVLATMVEAGILAPVLPEITAAGVYRLTRLIAREAAAGITPEWERRLAALLPANPAVADAVTARLRLSNARRKRIACAVEPLPDEPIRAVAYRIGVECTRDRALISADDSIVAATMSALDGHEPLRLPISGGALVSLGVTAGPDVAALMQAVERQWIAEDFPGLDRVEQLARNAADQWLRAHKAR